MSFIDYCITNFFGGRQQKIFLDFFSFFLIFFHKRKVCGEGFQQEKNWVDRDKMDSVANEKHYTLNS